MTLGFMQLFPKDHRKLAHQPTYFPEKILACLEQEKLSYPDFFAHKYAVVYWDKFGDKIGSQLTDLSDETRPKRHTIRGDIYNRWKAGNDIHFVVGNQTRHRFQFAPVVKCKSVQKIEIVYWMGCGGFPAVVIDERSLSKEEIEQLAVNDGFASVWDFISWFNVNFTGNLIHWTDLKY